MKRRGLSLLELLFTATLLGLVFMVMLNLLPSSLMSVRQGEHRLSANALSQAVMDECSSCPYDYLLVDGSYNPTSVHPLGAMLGRQDRLLDDGTEFLPRLDVSGVTGIPRRSLARVRLTLSWKERTGQRTLVREMEISSLLR